eukprot:Anaeramoba_flamelloidesc39936_g1_i1.p2 GENE.c39936_g1_i1~~c39936_g1_i1.p2  ORF type:complete len:101 (-),score=11.03 c39936_g1_i1:302-604(-)
MEDKAHILSNLFAKEFMEKYSWYIPIFGSSDVSSFIFPIKPTINYNHIRKFNSIFFFITTIKQIAKCLWRNSIEFNWFSFSYGKRGFLFFPNLGVYTWFK